MEQLERIRKMEQALNECIEAVEALDRALEAYCAVQEQMKALFAYYESPLWLQDYDDENDDRIPKDMSRGVLSQDAVWDLLTDEHRLRAMMRELCGADGAEAQDGNVL